ncbi:MAG: GMC family oxidoreductase [Candidatus Dadabacteria bacterium]|nr:MAG: GMC family oxidoreductase [Candidatus Dadabacteria bacterium]
MTELSARVVVIGTGSGGAVVAAMLAQAGVDVLMLEEGRHVPSSQFTQRDADMYDKLFRDRGLQSTADGSISVLQGSCVGGSTVINQADVTPIPEELFAHWSSHYELSGISYRDFRRAAETVERRIGAGPIADHEINANNRRLVEAAQRRGLRAGFFRDNRVGCVGSGYCHLGCSYDAKQSALITWIPDALRAGARLLPQHRVERVIVRDGRVSGVIATRLDAARQPVETVSIRCDHVFVCAGAIHTPLVLQQSGVGGKHVGQHLSLQPQGAVMARFSDKVRSFRGIPQSGYVDEWETVDEAHGFGGFRIEGIFGPPATATGFLPGFGKSVRPLLERYDHLGASLILVPDQPSGAVSPTAAGRPDIAYRLSPDVFRRLHDGMREAARLYFDAGAEEVWFSTLLSRSITHPDQIDDLLVRTPWRAISLRMISAHPQGTARMSDHPGQGVVDSTFAVRGVRNLYVADASVFPTTSSSHTMLPVMAFARIAAERWLARFA